MYEEDDFLQLSGIQHFAFCKRQWALAYIELQWLENVRTVEGKLLHENAHDAAFKEKRGEIIIERAMPIHSRALGISGECDVVEFHKNENGISLAKYPGKYQVIPIEYKRGKPKHDDVDELQVTAQALCLEEMLCCNIESGYIYYGETRHRCEVVFTEQIRQKVMNYFEEMHQYFQRRYTPLVKQTKSCNACSLKDICLPVLHKNKSVSSYIDQMISEEGRV